MANVPGMPRNDQDGRICEPRIGRDKTRKLVLDAPVKWLYVCGVPQPNDAVLLSLSSGRKFM